VITVNTGVAMSAGLLILLAGHKRYAMKYSTAMIHPGSAVHSGDYEQMQESQKNYKRTVDMMADYIIERTNITKKKLSNNWTRDWYVSDKEQAELGVVDKIVDSLDEVF
jgi:ATP-dependent Clp protease protease subunit